MLSKLGNYRISNPTLWQAQLAKPDCKIPNEYKFLQDSTLDDWP